MRAWPLHALFATLLVGSLAAKERRAEVPVDPVDFERAITRVARSQGLVLHGYVPLIGSNFRAQLFEAPGCSRPVLVVTLSMSLDLEAVLHLALEPDGEPRYVYVDRTWEKPDRVAFYAERMKYAVLKTLGLRRYVPDPRLLLVESPSGCEVANAVDWRNVWNRDYVGLTGAATEAR